MRGTLRALAPLAVLVIVLAGIPAVVSAQDEAAQETPQSELTEITYQKVDEQLQVFIRVEGPFTFETLEIQAPLRLVLDFRGVSKISAAPIVEVGDIGISSIRTGQFQPDVARVVFDLADAGPAHSLTQVENGLKVVFWMEGAPAEPPAPVKPLPKVKPVEPPPVRVAAEGRREYFVKVGAGLMLPIVSETTGTQNISLYAESGLITQTLNLNLGWAADLAFGTYLSPSTRVGLGVTLQSAGVTTAIQGEFPDPFVMNDPATVDFSEETIGQTLMNFYVFGLFTLTKSESMEISAGPMLGYARADYGILENFGMTDEVTEDGRTITITDQIFSKDSVSGLSLGVWASGQYALGRNLSLVVDARLFYFNPLHSGLGLRANLSGLDVLAGIQYNF